MNLIKEKPAKILITLLFLLAVIFRIICIPHTNYDMTAHNVPWYMTLYQDGIVKSMATEFANYSPPYTYFLALATFTHDFIPPLTAIKLIPIFFDVLGSFFVYRIIKLKFAQGPAPLLAASIYLAAPTVILNSASWGQADSLYTAFFLACLYFILTKRPFPAMLCVGIAFAIKAQGTFFLPFLAILAIRKKIPWSYFAMMPFAYIIAILPVVLAGRPFLEALLIYKKQSVTYSVISMYAPNAYLLIPNEWYSWLAPAGIIGTVILLAYWINSTAKSGIEFDDKHIVLIALISVALAPFLLPKMHDRYFYPADVLSIVLAFYWPSLWFVPLLYQFASASAVSIFLFHTDPSYVVIGFLCNAIALAAVLRTQWLAENRAEMKRQVSAPLSLLTAILIPVILLGFSINLILTPAFIRVQYAASHTSARQYSLEKSERFQLASVITEYLKSEKKSQILRKFSYADGSPVLSEADIIAVDGAKATTGKIFKAWHMSLTAVLILGLLAWIGDWLPKFRRGAKQGGWLAIISAVILGAALIHFNVFDPTTHYPESSALTMLFPKSFLFFSSLFTLLALGGGGFLFTRISLIPPHAN